MKVDVSAATGSRQKYEHACAFALAGVVVIAAGLAVAACSSGPISCPQWILSPVVVEVRDAMTGAPSAVGATGTLRSGESSWPLELPGVTEQLRLYPVGPPGGPGLYDVLIQKPGYHNWARNRIEVRSGACGIEKEVTVHADLQRSS